MIHDHPCEWCATPLPAGRRARRFCSDRCRKRASRAAEAVKAPPPGTPDGPVSAAVRAALAEVSFDTIGRAQAEMAVALARLVDAGSVPAARELRPLLADLALVEDPEHLEFLAAISTPSRRGTL